MRGVVATLAGLAVLAGGSGCVAPVAGPDTASAPVATTTPSTATASTSTAPSSTTTAAPTPTPTPTGPKPSDGQPVRATLTIPALKIAGLSVEPYPGATDDRAGTLIQNRGIAASPFGGQGGTGPGGVGNYQVTAHRTTKPAPFKDLPGLAEGEVAYVDAGGVRYAYRITETRTTSFRSAASLAEQRAPVPGRPGVPATQAMITLSTCLTPEDHAAGNFWADANDNPEHRADKIGVLVATAPAPA